MEIGPVNGKEEGGGGKACIGPYSQSASITVRQYGATSPGGSIWFIVNDEIIYSIDTCNAPGLMQSGLLPPINPPIPIPAMHLGSHLYLPPINPPIPIPAMHLGSHATALIAGIGMGGVMGGNSPDCRYRYGYGWGSGGGHSQ